MRVIIKAFTKDHYQRDILVFDNLQVRMQDVKVEDKLEGLTIYPSDFPEAERFVVEIEWI